MSLNDDILRGMGLYLDGVAVRYMRSVKFATNPNLSTLNLVAGVHDFTLVRN